MWPRKFGPARFCIPNFLVCITARHPPSRRTSLPAPRPGEKKPGEKNLAKRNWRTKPGEQKTWAKRTSAVAGGAGRGGAGEGRGQREERGAVHSVGAPSKPAFLTFTLSPPSISDSGNRHTPCGPAWACSRGGGGGRERRGGWACSRGGGGGLERRGRGGGNGGV